MKKIYAFIPYSCLLILFGLSFSSQAQNLDSKVRSDVRGHLNLAVGDLSLETLSFAIAAEAPNTPVEVSANGNIQRLTIGPKETIVEVRVADAQRGLSINGNITKLSFSDYPLTSIQLGRMPSLKILLLGNTDLREINLSSNVNLEELDLNSNNLPSIDLSKNSHLKTLILSASGVQSLDLSHQAELEKLLIKYNDLEELDLSACPNLIFLACSNNKLRELHLASCPKLEWLDASQNLFTSLDLSMLSRLSNLIVDFNKSLTSIRLPQEAPNLAYLNVQECQLSDLSLGRYPGLRKLNCSANQLTSIDLSSCPGIEALYVSANNLRNIDIRPLKHLNDFYFSNNAFSAELLNRLYMDLPALAVRPNQPNLFNGGTNQAEISKTFLAMDKNWLPAVRGNASMGREAIVIQGKKGVMLRLKLNTDDEQPLHLSLDKGDGKEMSVNAEESASRRGEVEVSIPFMGSTVVLYGSISGIEAHDGELSKVDLSHASSKLKKVVMVNCGIDEVMPGVGLVHVDLAQNHLNFFIAKGMAGLRYLNVAQNRMKEASLNNLFTSLPFLSPKPSSANLFVDGNPGAATVNKEVATQKGWLFGKTQASLGICANNMNWEMKGRELRLHGCRAIRSILIYSLDGQLIQSLSNLQDERRIFLPAQTVVVRMMDESGRTSSVKL